MGYRQVRTGNGTPMHAAPWNLPSAYDALELQIKRVDEFLETSNFQHPEISLEAIIHWVKHLGWFYIDVAYPNWGGYDPPQWLDGAENLAKTPFWKNPPEAFSAILADGDLPMNQRMLRGYSICRVVGYMGMILWEPPKDLTFP
ncbi:MAG: hypothetical protein VW729_16205, partial [Deltaproteobacteria bacterium]